MLTVINQPMTRSKLQRIKNRKIITNKNDIVKRTWLKNHPSLGESDQVVWVYEIVRDEFKQLYNL